MTHEPRPADSLPEGEFCHQLARRLFPICRSITGPGVRETLDILAEYLPGLTRDSVPSGYQAFDWIVPDEWTIRAAYIEDEQGERIVDFSHNNLHVVGYSTPVDEWMTREELDQHLYSLPDQPDAIPYATSYYHPHWGFCLPHNQRTRLKSGRYRAVVDSTLEPGQLDYAEIVLPGESSDEVFLSTYVCHPSMANNELSGPVVVTALVRWLLSLPTRKYTYRVVFIPETIGSLVYLSRNLTSLKDKMVAGFNVTCVGDDRGYSYLPSRAGNTLADKVALHVLGHKDPGFTRHTWLDRGSDERQYCAPGVDLPVVSMMRSKYGTYPEYHTSLDDLTLVTPSGLQGGFDALKEALTVLEHNVTPTVTTLGEPQLGRRNLYPSLSTNNSFGAAATTKDVLSYCDGQTSLLDIAELIGEPMTSLLELIETLRGVGLIK